LKDEAAGFEDEEDVPKPLNSDSVPGLALSHATHLVASALFCTRHTSQSQLPSGFLNLSNPRQLPEDREAGTVLLPEAGTELPCLVMSSLLTRSLNNHGLKKKKHMLRNQRLKD